MHCVNFAEVSARQKLEEDRRLLCKEKEQLMRQNQELQQSLGRNCYVRGKVDRTVLFRSHSIGLFITQYLLETVIYTIVVIGRIFDFLF